MDVEWGYGANNGPPTWGSVAPMAVHGKHQSPIDICPQEAQFDPTLTQRELWTTYVPANAHTLINLGHTFQVKIDGRGSMLQGGPLNHNYQVEQFHFHWGGHGNPGSEHSINGQFYDAELHIVHYNADYFSCVDEATRAPDGVCVLAVFLRLGAENPHLAPIIAALPSIPYKNDNAPLLRGFDPHCLLPADRSRYWTYPGSLTTPPCSECITWIVFKDHIEISEDQLTALRWLHQNERQRASYSPDDLLIDTNHRPPCSLNGRVVRASFPHEPEHFLFQEQQSHHHHHHHHHNHNQHH